MFYITPKKDCPHVLKDNLIPIEKFKEIPFKNLKCEKCDEKEELWICLICGLAFCSRYTKGHFVEHNRENKEHLLCLGIMDLSIWCYECTKENKTVPEEEKGYYIVSEKTNEYVKIYEKFKFPEEEKIVLKEENKLINKEIFNTKNELCSHALNDEIKNEFKEDFIFFKETMAIVIKFMEKSNCICLCLSCMKRLINLDELNKHFESDKHNLYINLLNWNIICRECQSEYNISLVNNIFKYRIFFHLLSEKNMVLPNLNLLSKEEVFEIKYKKLVEKFKQKKYSNILFMVGAGISTSAGIPDFRSKSGLFQQLQDKYKLSSPEEFFYITTFLKNPQYFYEFTKIFDLSQVKPTISHKFMSFMVSKNIVKYVFTQNIDGLETKAKIPEQKLIFAHGNFNQGHCAKCNKSIDIKLINKGIELGEVYYCPHCKGPCKPKVVFYGENLPKKFYEKQEECDDVDLIIIMGTSLKVQPFASIPYMTNPNADIAVFNMDQVGNYLYSKLYCNKLFIQGKTDEKVIQFLKDTDLIKEFKDFVKKEYNEDLHIEEDNLEKITQNMGNLDINK